MEMTFYDDNMSRSGKMESKSMKRPITLDLESPETISKKQQRFNAILTSPDLHMLKLASPELERFILSNGNITMTPTPTQYLFPKNVTVEQENYAKGFLEALNKLHQSQYQMSTSDLLSRISTGNTPLAANPPSEMGTEAATSNFNTISKVFPGLYFQPISSPTSVIKSLGNVSKNVKQPILNVRPPSVESSNSCNSTSMSNNSNSTAALELSIKEELQTVPNDFSSPPLSPIGKGPIDLVDQERLKLERKRYRNRVAATKCRKRKLEKISQLEDKVKELKGDNTKLEMIVENLREQVCFLKQEVLEHAKKGCQIMLTKV